MANVVKVETDNTVNIDTQTKVVIKHEYEKADEDFSTTSVNPLQNKTITNKINDIETDIANLPLPKDWETITDVTLTEEVARLDFDLNGEKWNYIEICFLAAQEYDEDYEHYYWTQLGTASATNAVCTYYFNGKETFKASRTQGNISPFCNSTGFVFFEAYPYSTIHRLDLLGPAASSNCYVGEEPVECTYANRKVGTFMDDGFTSFAVECTSTGLINAGTRILIRGKKCNEKN